MSEDSIFEKRLREAWLAEPAGAPSGDCPSDEEIWSASRGELAPARAGEILDHSAGCAACSASFALASELGREAAPARVAGLRPPARPSRPGYLVAVIAAAVVALAGFWLLLRSSGPLPPSPATEIARHVRTSLWRAGEAGDERLTGGQRVRPGDKLYLRLDAEVPVHLYVVNRDEAGEASVLFPVEGAQWSNPIAPGTGRRIPGDPSWAYDSWEVSSAGGRESFVVVASLEPLEQLEAAMERLDAAAPRDEVRGEPPAAGGEGRLAGEETSGLAEALAALKRTGEPGGSVIVEEIVLDNPR